VNRGKGRIEGKGEERIGKGIVFQNVPHFMPVTLVLELSIDKTIPSKVET